MRALAIVYERDAGPGVFEQQAEAEGVAMDRWVATQEDAPPQEPARYDAVVVLGASTHADQEEENPWLREQKALVGELLERGTPLIGVCLGSQLLAEAAGAAPVRLERPEIGWFGVGLTAEGRDDPVTGRLPATFTAFEWHSYAAPLPPGAEALASSEACLQAFRLGEEAWGVQFHPEVALADAESWIDDIRPGSDPARIGIEPAAFRAETRDAMAAWNRLGRDLFSGFLEAARARAPR
ncbi:MAG: type 1 glutamine amidotransferase [Solirubrobacterales bacterium]